MVYVCVFFVHWCYGWNIFMVYDYEPPAYCRQMIPQGVEHGSISTHGNIKQNIWTLIDEYEKVSPGKKQRKPGSRCLSRLGATSFHYSAARTLVKLRFVALEISSTSQKACWICSFKTPLFNLPPFCGWNSMHQSHPMNWGWTWTLQQALRCNPWSCSIRCWHLRQIKKAPLFYRSQGLLVHPIYMGCHPSHWRTPSFFMVKTTNQVNINHHLQYINHIMTIY